MRYVRAVRNYISRYKLKSVWWPALVGSNTNKVNVEGSPNLVYIRFFDNTESIAYCDDMSLAYLDLPVKVGYDPEDPKRLRILGRLPRTRYHEDDTSLPLVPKHGETHRWLSMSGIDDPVPVELRQFMPFRIEAAGGLNINVYRGLIYTGSGKAVFQGVKSFNLSDYVPATAGQSRWVLISYVAGQGVVATPGVAKSGSLTMDDLPDPPSGTLIVIGAVRLYNGQMEIAEARTTTDIIDLRFPIWHQHDDRYTKLEQSQQISIAAYGLHRHPHEPHWHVESDISDLVHDAVKIKGIDVDASNIGDGKALVYNQSANKIVYATAGGGIRIKEIDGLPDILSVTTLKVTNGTLGDEGGGTATLAIPQVSYSPAWTIRVDGALAVATDIAGFVVPSDAVIPKVYIRCKNAGTSGNTIVDVNKNGSTIFTDQNSRPTLPYNDSDGIAVGVPQVTQFVEGDLITIDIDAVATGASGLDVCVIVEAIAPLQMLTDNVLAVQVFS